jgi:four helix bundle protein
LTFKFSLDIITFTEGLEKLRKFPIANQLFRCGVPIGANVREAQNSESKADFIHKMKIAAKETEETIYWLDLCKAAASYPDPDELYYKIKSIEKILNKIIGTSKNRYRKV